MPDLPSAILLFKTMLVCGLSLWSAITVLNNIGDFRGAAGAIARTLAMTPLREEPAIPTPLLRRALRCDHWSVLALAAILAMQALATALLGLGGFELIRACLTAAAPARGIWFSTAGLGVMALVWLSMMSGGLWFGYWIRQGELQLTQIALLTMTLVAALAVNA